ncbi:MAG: Ig-like domain-containing protein, partial [Planctomycetota bacterium]
GVGGLATQQFRVTVLGENEPPTGSPDAYQTNEDVPLNVSAASGVLTNDEDLDGNPMTAQLQSGATHGTVVLNPDGSFEYTPDLNFHGVDSFTYRVSDGTYQSGIVSVELNITAVNDDPMITSYLGDAIAEVNAAEGETTVAAVVASDVDGDSLTYELIGGADQALFEIDPGSGVLRFKQAPDFESPSDADADGVYEAKVQVQDGAGGSDSQEIHVTVVGTNDPPAGAGDAYAVDEDAALGVAADSGVLVNDSDPEGDQLAATLQTGPRHGFLTLQADGSFTYLPQADFHGVDIFSYRATDGASQSPPIIVTVTVAPLNDAPRAMADAFSVFNATPLLVGNQGVLANDVDVDGDALTAELVESPAHGTLLFNADGSFTYTPDPEHAGETTFTYRTLDGSSASAPTTVIIRIGPTPGRPYDGYAVDGMRGILGFSASAETFMTDLLASPTQSPPVANEGSADAAVTLPSESASVSAPFVANTTALITPRRISERIADPSDDPDVIQSVPTDPESEPASPAPVAETTTGPRDHLPAVVVPAPVGEMGPLDPLDDQLSEFELQVHQEQEWTNLASKAATSLFAGASTAYVLWSLHGTDFVGETTQLVKPRAALRPPAEGAPKG